MSYFGGLGSGKGWHTFRFIVTPNELRNIFSGLDYWFVLTNQRVPVNYRVEDKESLFESYELYFEKVFSGELFLKDDWKIESRMRTSITDDYQKIEFELIFENEKKKSNDFKLVRPTEPVINVAPFSLYPIESGGLSVAYSESERNIGLEFNYPKFISLDSENHRLLHETKDFPTYNLYLNLQERIKKISKKAKILRNEKLIKPNFWISPKCIEIFLKNFNNKKENIRAI
jgi:hypothetical protein